MKKDIIFLVILTIFFAAMFGCKNNPVKPATPPPQDTTKKDTTKKDTTKSKFAPQIISFSPEKGFGDEMITLTGKYFGTDLTKISVQFDGRDCSLYSSSRLTDTISDIVLMLPVTSKSSKFYIKTPNGSATLSKEFIIITMPQFSINVDYAYPRSGCPGEPFFIKGQNLLAIKNDLKIFLSPFELKIDFINDTMISTRYPDYPGEYNLDYTVKGKLFEGNPTGERCHKYLVGNIIINGIYPAISYIGDTIKITCSYFGSTSKPKVYFGVQEAEIINVSLAYVCHCWNNQTKIPDEIFIPGTVTCRIPNNPSPNVSVIGYCGSTTFNYMGLSTVKIKSAYAEIVNLKTSFYVSKNPSDSTIQDSTLNIVLPLANIISFDNKSSAISFSTVKNSGIGQGSTNNYDSNLYSLHYTFSTNAQIYQYHNYWNGSYHNYLSDNSLTDFKFTNFKKISEDNKVIIYELRGQDIVANRVSVKMEYKYYVSYSNMLLWDIHLISLLDQTPDSYIRIYLLK